MTIGRTRAIAKSFPGERADGGNCDQQRRDWKPGMTMSTRSSESGQTNDNATLDVHFGIIVEARAVDGRGAYSEGPGRPQPDTTISSRSLGASV